jgi:hypoxanthine phosphoribosyltransferase
LSKAPTRPGKLGIAFKSPPLGKGKTVLIVDDICTQGYSLEAARALVEATGGKAIALTWLKTPGKNDFIAISDVGQKVAPYTPNKTDPSKMSLKFFGFSDNIINHKAEHELAVAFENYEDWDWQFET